MKHLIRISALALTCTALFACKEPETVTSDTLEVTAEIKSETPFKVPGTLEFIASVSDDNTDLSTLEVAASLADGTLITSKSIRTPGRSATVEESLEIPFAPSMPEGGKLIVSFEAINIDGEKLSTIQEVALTRPTLPQTLYMKMGETVLPLTMSENNPSLYLSEGGMYESITTATIATAEDLSQAEFIWGAGDADNVGKICSFSEAAGISISYPSYIVTQYTFDAVDFKVGIKGEELNVSINGTPLMPQNELLYASIAFKKGDKVEITGLDNLEEAMNDDFFESKDNDGIEFVREDGTYEVYYSPRYNHIYVVKSNAVAPECLWIVGHGFTSARTWHSDFASGGWSNSPVTHVGYAVKIDTDIYQCSLYLSNRHEWESFEFEVYSDISDGDNMVKTNGFCGKSLSGDTQGVRLSSAGDGNPGLTSDNGFQPGYYTLKFNNATGDINLTRHTEWVDADKSDIIINGVNLLIDKEKGFCYENISFARGTEVSISGIELSELNRDFFTVMDGKAFFNADNGTYLVKYYTDYRYTWLEDASNNTYPNCLYILGNGKWAAPQYPRDFINEPDFEGWNRMAPYYVVAPRIADNTYQATMSLSTDNNAKEIYLEFYSDLFWGQDNIDITSLQGDSAELFVIVQNDANLGLAIKNNPDAAFTDGNYRFTFTADGAKITANINKI